MANPAGDTSQGKDASQTDNNGVAATPPDSDDNENKYNHIFNNPAHNLEGVVSEQGGPRQAYQAIRQAVQGPARQAAGAGGRYQVTVRVGSHNVTVRGIVLGNEVRIGTAYLKP